MEYKVITSSSPEGLNEKINNLIKDGWKPMGSHQVVEQHRQNRYSGMQHQDTLIKHEYSISMVKESKPNVIEVDISFYHPNDDETQRVYDEEGMREEFEYKLDCIIKNAGL
jgi:methylaspartate ammonia-lyase